MSETQQLKEELMDAAGQDANAIITGVILANGGKSPKSQMPVTFDPKDQGTQEAILGCYEIRKSAYWGLLKAEADKTGVWPDPVTQEAAASNPQAALQGVLKTTGLPAPVATLITQALGLITGAPVAQAVPAPGSDVPAAPASGASAAAGS